MQGNYGSRFLNQWKTGQALPNGGDAGVRNAMRTWAKKLSGFVDFPEAITAVLESLPDEPPTLPQFHALCRSAALRLNESAPRLEHRMTPEEKAKADAVAKAVAAKVVARDTRDHKEWAKRLKACHEAGETLSTVQINAYKEALEIEDEYVEPQALAA